jgi:hypothetical protein
VENPPASTFVVVSRLMRPGWLIEVEAVCRARCVKRKRRPRRAPPIPGGLIRPPWS